MLPYTTFLENPVSTQYQPIPHLCLSYYHLYLFAQIAVTFKNHPVLKDVSWDVKQGERVGLVGINGAGKTTQLQIITGALQPDSGEVMKAKSNMRISYLTQEFDVEPT